MAKIKGIKTKTGDNTSAVAKVTADAAGAAPVSSGVVTMLAQATVPSGWLLCDGTEYSQSTYSTLYGVIGSVYNTHPTLGSPTAGNFRVPDFRDVFPLAMNPGTTTGLLMHLDAGNLNSYSGTGTTWADLSGNGKNVTLTNGPTYSSSDGGYFTFDGVNDHLGSISLANPNGQLTFEAVINYNNTGSYQNIFEVSPFDRPMLWIDNNGKFEVSYPTASGGVTSANAYNGQKITVTAVYDTTTSPGVKLYVNGSLVGSNSSAHVSWSNPSTFTLFNRATGSSTFSGKVYSVKIYDRALSASEIQQNYNANVQSPSTKSLGVYSTTGWNHTHTVPAHAHTLGNHTHTLGSHTHSVAAHSHTIAHTHTIPDHTHAIYGHIHYFPGHCHSGTVNVSASHYHQLDVTSDTATGSGANRVSNTNSGNMTSSSAGAFTVGFSGTIGSTNLADNGFNTDWYSYAETQPTGPSSGAATQGVSSANSGTSAIFNTGSPSAASGAPSSNTTSTDGSAATGTANPPYFGVHFIIKT